MSKKQISPLHPDPWAGDPRGQRPAVPASYTAAIAAALLRCQHCDEPVGLTRAPADAPAVTCTTCMRGAVTRLLGHGEPPF